MIRKLNFIVIGLFLFTNVVYSQLQSNIKAKLYFAEAEKAYNQGDFRTSITYLDKAENTLGETVPRILALKIKAKHFNGDFIEAKTLIDLYTREYMNTAAKTLNDEILALYIEIEEAAEKKQMLLDQEEMKLKEEKRALEKKIEFIHKSGYALLKSVDVERLKRDLIYTSTTSWEFGDMYEFIDVEITDKNYYPDFLEANFYNEAYIDALFLLSGRWGKKYFLKATIKYKHNYHGFEKWEISSYNIEHKFYKVKGSTEKLSDLRDD